MSHLVGNVLETGKFLATLWLILYLRAIRFGQDAFIPLAQCSNSSVLELRIDLRVKGLKLKDGSIFVLIEGSSKGWEEREAYFSTALG